MHLAKHGSDPFASPDTHPAEVAVWRCNYNALHAILESYPDLLTKKTACKAFVQRWLGNSFHKRSYIRVWQILRVLLQQAEDQLFDTVQVHNLSLATVVKQINNGELIGFIGKCTYSKSNFLETEAILCTYTQNTDFCWQRRLEFLVELLIPPLLEDTNLSIFAKNIAKRPDSGAIAMQLVERLHNMCDIQDPRIANFIKLLT